VADIEASADDRASRGVAPYYVIALLMAAPAILIGYQLPSWIVFVPSPVIERQADFRPFYAAGYALRTGRASELYSFAAMREIQDRTVAADRGARPFIHPSYEALIFVPLARFSYHVAYLLWVGVNVALLFGIYRLLRPRLMRLCRMDVAWLPWALLPAFFPIPYAVMQGQDSLLLLLILLISMKRMEDGAQVQAGLLLGLGSFRFQLLIPVVLLFLLWRAWRFVAGFLLAGSAMFALSILVSGWRSQLAYLDLLKLLASRPYLQPIGHMVNLRSLVAHFGGGPNIVIPLSLVILAVALSAGLKCGWQERWMLSLSATALITYHFILHDLSILAVPLLVSIERTIERENWPRLGFLGVIFTLPIIMLVDQDAGYLPAVGSLCFFLVLAFTSGPFGFLGPKAARMVSAQSR
jgi:hypothetical protein